MPGIYFSKDIEVNNRAALPYFIILYRGWASSTPVLFSNFDFHLIPNERVYTWQSLQSLDFSFKYDNNQP